MSANMMHTKHCGLAAAGPQFLRSMGDPKINPDESWVTHPAAPQPGERINLPRDMQQAEQQPWPPALEVARAAWISCQIIRSLKTA